MYIYDCKMMEKIPSGDQFNGKSKIAEIEQLDPDIQQPAQRHPINKCNFKANRNLQ